MSHCLGLKKTTFTIFLFVSCTNLEKFYWQIQRYLYQVYPTYRSKDMVSTNSSSEESPPSKRTRSAANATPSPSPTSTRIKPRMTANMGRVDAQIQVLKQLKGNSPLKRNEKIAIMLIFFGLHKEHLVNKQKNRGRAGPAKVTQRIIKMMGLGGDTVNNLVRDFTDAYLSKDPEQIEDVFKDSRLGGNFEPKNTRISNSRQCYSEVKNFVRQERQQFKSVTAVQVMDFLIQKGWLKVKVKDGVVDKKDHAAALRATQRYLLRRDVEL